MDRVDQLYALYINLVNQINLPHDQVEDLLRMQVVYAISCLDRLIHDLVLDGMIQIFQGRKAPTTAYENFQVSLQLMNSMSSTSGPPPENILSAHIINKHKYQSFQEPGNIKTALNLIWAESHKWQKIATAMNMSENDVRVTLTNVVTRRNQIVHEADIDLFSESLQPLAHANTRYMVDFIRKLGKVIFDLVQ